MSDYHLFVSDGVKIAFLELQELSHSSEILGHWRHLKPFQNSFIKNASGTFAWNTVSLEGRPPGYGVMKELILKYNDGSIMLTLSPLAFPDKSVSSYFSKGSSGTGYFFSGEQYIQKQGSPISRMPIFYKVIEKQYDWSRVWFGLGGKASGALPMQNSPLEGKGKEYMLAFLVNLHTRELVFITLESNRSCYGFGGSVDCSFFIATGISNSRELLGISTGGWDINISFGLAWSKLLGGIYKLEKFAKFMASMPQLLRTMLAITTAADELAKHEDWLTWAKSLICSSETDVSQRGLSVWDTPVGVGIEVSVGKSEGKIVGFAHRDLNWIFTKD